MNNEPLVNLLWILGVFGLAFVIAVIIAMLSLRHFEENFEEKPPEGTDNDLNLDGDDLRPIAIHIRAAPPQPTEDAPFKPGPDIDPVPVATATVEVDPDAASELNLSPTGKGKEPLL